MYIHIEKLYSLRLALSLKVCPSKNASLLDTIHKTYTQITTKDLIKILDLLKALKHQEDLLKRADFIGVAYCQPIFKKEGERIELKFLEGHSFDTACKKLDCSEIEEEQRIEGCLIQAYIRQSNSLHPYCRNETTIKVKMLRRELDALLEQHGGIELICFFINQWWVRP